MTERVPVPAKWCLTHDRHHDPNWDDDQLCADGADNPGPCRLVPLFYETEGDTPNDHQKEGQPDE